MNLVSRREVADALPTSGSPYEGGRFEVDIRSLRFPLLHGRLSAADLIRNHPYRRNSSSLPVRAAQDEVPHKSQSALPSLSFPPPRLTPSLRLHRSTTLVRVPAPSIVSRDSLTLASGRHLVRDGLHLPRHPQDVLVTVRL